ncbi:MAG: galactokinase [Dehalococcoidia bacterium]|nr:MAG: galactokinase [Dehalococcoidia bacterium]
MNAVARTRRERALARSFARRFAREPHGLARAPGRVNLIGEHTDYNEGFVLPVAIDRAVIAAFAARSDRQVRVYSLGFDQEDSFPLDNIERLEGDVWSNYVRGVAAVLQEAGYRLTGVDMVIQGDVPIGAGLASSASLEVAVLGTFQHAAALAIDPRDQALLAQRAENEFVGVGCGVMDQMAAVMSHRDHALLIDCRSLETKAVPLNMTAHGLKIVVAHTGVRRALSDSAYSQRQQECSRAAQVLAQVIGARPVVALRDVTSKDLAAHEGNLPDQLARRARHVVGENERVLKSVEALRQDDLPTLGRLLYASHQSLAGDYEVSSPELDLMVELACHLEGVVGARMTGAGFGGCTVNLVRKEAIDSFREQVIETYRSRTSLPAEMYVCEAVDGLRIIAGANAPASHSPQD